ncbi:MAG: LPD7 domain-containing protein [Thermoguttaceae bacterium]
MSTCKSVDTTYHNRSHHRSASIRPAVDAYDKAAVLFGLEMAIQKFGSRIACDGSVEWKRMVTKVAAQHGISVQFTDEEMQHALRLLQRLANPRQRKRGGR